MSATSKAESNVMSLGDWNRSLKPISNAEPSASVPVIV